MNLTDSKQILPNKDGFTFKWSNIWSFFLKEWHRALNKRALCHSNSITAAEAANRA